MSQPKPPLTRGIRPDDYQTPKHALDPLYPYLPKSWIIWECACGEGNLVDAFIDHGYQCIGTDLFDGYDYRMWEPEKWDCTVTNPPYTLKNHFLQRAYALGKPFAFLMPLTAFDSRLRQDLFRSNGVEVILLPRRLNFTTPFSVKHNSWFTTAWFTWKLNIGKQLTFWKETK